MAFSTPEKQREYMRKYYAENRDRMLEGMRKWREKNGDKHRASSLAYHYENRERILVKKREYAKQTREKRAHYLRFVKYGISAEQYSELLEKQNGLCAICRTNPAGVVDHDHNTGLVRGILCSPCNTGIGLFREDPDRLRSAMKYIAQAVVVRRAA